MDAALEMVAVQEHAGINTEPTLLLQTGFVSVRSAAVTESGSAYLSQGAILVN